MLLGAHCTKENTVKLSAARHRFSYLIAVAACLLAAHGCGRKGLQVEFVEGLVLIDSQPIAGASVNFTPKDGGLPAFGRTNAKGLFRLTTQQAGRPDAGAVIGDYAVTISKYEYVLPNGQPPASGDYDGLPQRPIVPRRFNDVNRSGLTAEVRKGGGRSDRYRFELSSSVEDPAEK